eukprot:COSAG06_NODE_2074_length_7656_cov_11.758237_8_plen_65_part_00
MEDDVVGIFRVAEVRVSLVLGHRAPARQQLVAVPPHLFGGARRDRLRRDSPVRFCQCWPCRRRC